jgi:hypothetical protein
MSDRVLNSSDQLISIPMAALPKCLTLTSCYQPLAQSMALPMRFDEGAALLLFSGRED